MVIADAHHEGSTYGSIRYLYHVLFHVLLHTQLFPLPSFHELNSGSSLVHPDSLCNHKRLVQDINPHNSHRRHNGQSSCLCRALRVQSAMVAMRASDTCRTRRHRPNDTSSALFARGGVRVSDRYSNKLYNNFSDIEQ